MKATLTLNVDDDEDIDKLQLYLKAPDLLRALQDVKELLRSWDKYGIPAAIESQIAINAFGCDEPIILNVDLIEKLREEINTIICERVGEV